MAIAEGPGWDGGWLTSAGTGRDGYLQLVDLAPTVLAALGRPAPEKLFAGHSRDRRCPAGPADLADAVRGEHDADRRAGAQRGVAGDVLRRAGRRAAGCCSLLVVPLLIRARRHAGPTGPAAAAAAAWRCVEVLLIAAALAIPAALVADAVAVVAQRTMPGLVFGLVDRSR